MLANELFLLIFQHLSLKDLINIELVSKKWRNLSYLTFSSMKNLNLEMFSNYFLAEHTIRQNPALLWNFFNHIFTQKLSSERIETFNLEKASSIIGINRNEIVQLFEKFKFANLKSLNLKRWKNANLIDSFQKLTSNMPNLQTIELDGLELTDENMLVLFQNCKSLNSLILNNAHISGDFFDKLPVLSLKRLILNNSQFRNTAPFIRYLGQKRVPFETISLDSTMIRTPNLSKIVNALIEHHNLTLTSFTMRVYWPKNSVDYVNTLDVFKFRNLVELELGGCFINNNLLVAKCLNSCLKLERLCLKGCYNLDDRVFSSMKINSPIKYLNISQTKSFTDVTLDNLVQLKDTLVQLEIENCEKITCKKIKNILIGPVFSKLRYLDAKYLDIDNSLLKKCLKQHKCKLYILAVFTEIDPSNFLENKPEDQVLIFDHHECKSFTCIKYRNLTFVTLRHLVRRQRDHEALIDLPLKQQRSTNRNVKHFQKESNF
jgi:hypothetical protein